MGGGCLGLCGAQVRLLGRAFGGVGHAGVVVLGARDLLLANERLEVRIRV